MAIQKFKDITISGREFRLGLVPAVIGDWIITQMGLQTYGRSDVYEKIQGHLLGAVSVYRDVGGERVPVRVYDSGRWLVPDLDLEYDLETVQSLVQESLDFNVGPFFAKRKATEAV